MTSIDLDGDYELGTEVSSYIHWARVAVFVALFLTVIALVAPGCAYAHKPEGAPISSEVERQFFIGATDQNGLGCCSEADGYREGIEYPEKLNAAYPHPGGVILREWQSSKDVPGGYRVNLAGLWYDVPPNKVVKSPPNPPNVTGAAVIWVTFTFNNRTIDDGMGSMHFEMTNNISNVNIRCFSPGNQF